MRIGAPTTSSSSISASSSSPADRHAPRDLHVEQVGALRLTSRSALLARIGATFIGVAVWTATAAASMIFSSDAFGLLRPLPGHRSEPGDDIPDLLEFRALVQEPACAGVQAATAVLLVRVVRQHDEDDLRRFRMH